MRNILRRLKIYIKTGFKLRVNVISSISICSTKTGNLQLISLLKSGTPFSAIRLGTTEANVVAHWIRNGKAPNTYPHIIKQNINTLSGFFPATDELLNEFCEQFLDVLGNSDFIGVRSSLEEHSFWDLERKVLSSTALNCKLSDIRVLTELIKLKNSWTSCLEGKRVLVIHPFKQTIDMQYKRREDIFANKLTLPNFELITMKAVQSLSHKAGESSFANWFEALSSMKTAIDHTDFDIALIGAGAYGMFLADHCKQVGKVGIHIGGALQLLFGIKGKRWEDPATSDYLAQYYNDFWVYPSISEKPVAFNAVENGCYWGGI